MLNASIVIGKDLSRFGGLEAFALFHHSVCDYTCFIYAADIMSTSTQSLLRAALSAFRTFVWFCSCLDLSVSSSWEGLRFVIVALPGLFSYLFVF